MRKSILLDILNVLLIMKDQKTDEVESFILNALSGEILDKNQRNKLKLFYSGLDNFSEREIVIQLANTVLCGNM